MNNDLEMNLASLRNKSKEHERDQETNESELLALQEENLELMKENKESSVGSFVCWINMLFFALSRMPVSFSFLAGSAVRCTIRNILSYQRSDP